MAERNPRTRWRCAAAFAPWLLLLLVLRASLVLAASDVSFWGEELSRGTAAKALIDGVPIPLHQLVYNEFEGGSLVSELASVPAFLLLGESLLAHKLVALVWLALVFAAGFALAWEHLGSRAAHVFGLLFVLAPASFQKLSLLNLGSHFGALLFLLGGLVFLLRLVLRDSPRARDALGLGFCAGFGIYYSFQVAVFALFALAVLATQRRAALVGRTGIAGWAGLALGLAPLGWMVSHVGGRVFDVHGPRGEAAAEASAFERASEFLTSVFAGRPWLDVVSIAAWILLVLAALGTVRDPLATPARRAMRVLALYFVLFTGVYFFSGYAQARIGHWFQFNRLSPIWAVATVLVAGALPFLERRRATRIAARTLVLLAALGGAADWFATMRGGIAEDVGDGWRRSARLSGVTYTNFFNHLREKRRLEPAEEAAIWFRFDEPSRGWIEPAATMVLFTQASDGMEEGTRFVAEHAPEGWRGLGLAWIRKHRGDLGASLDGAGQAPPESRAALLESVGRAAPNPKRLLEILRARRAREGLTALDVAALDALAVGLGYRMFEFPGEEDRRYFERRETAWCLNEPAFLAWCRSDPAASPERAHLEAGYRQAASERSTERSAR